MQSCEGNETRWIYTIDVYAVYSARTVYKVKCLLQLETDAGNKPDTTSKHQGIVIYC